MIDNKVHSTKLAIIISYPMSTSGIINCFIKKQSILLDLADFVFANLYTTRKQFSGLYMYFSGML